MFKVEQLDSSLDDLVSALERLVGVRVEAVRNLATQYDVCIWISHQTNLAMSGFNLTPQNLSFLASLGVRLSVSVKKSPP
jgi:hypothetical protein